MIDLLQGKSKHHIEDSVSLRVLTSAMAVVGIFAAAKVADTPEWLCFLGVAGTVLGSWLSYKKRHSSNLIGKIWISIGIILVAGGFFREILLRINMSVADARIPLTNMLIALVALHCFDLPRRRDLGLSALVGLTLIAAAATLSLDNTFTIYIICYCVLGITMLRADCISRTLTHGAQLSPAYRTVIRNKAPNRDLRTLAENTKIAAILAVTVFAVFLLMPRAEIGILKNVRVAAGLDLSFLREKFDSRFGNLLSPDGSIKANSKAYYGFAEELDTNYRGHLTDEIVLRVASPSGYYWRGMAYDVFDGIKWKMTQPKPVKTCTTTDGVSITLDPVPGLRYPRYANRQRVNQIFYVESDASNLLVCAPVPSVVYFPSQNLQVDAYGAIRSPIGIEKDMVYTVVSEVVKPDYQLMAGMQPPLETPNPRLQNYLQLPEKLNPDVALIAKQAAGAGSAFAQAQNIARFLRLNYKYDLNIAQTPPGTDSVSDFILQKKRGFCEHFASAFCIMCRTRGIPARLVTGYLPGQYNALTGLWDVRLTDAHSWVEIYIEKVGWVAIDPTPDALVGGFDGVSQSSALSWFSEEASRAINSGLAWLAQSPLGSTFSGLLPGIKWVIETVWNWGFVFLIASLLAAIGATLRLLRKRHPKPVYNAAPLVEESVSSQASTASYLSVLSALQNIGLARARYETPTDLLEKARPLLEKRGTPEVITLLEEFIDQYASVRFGRSLNSHELSNQANALSTKLQEPLPSLQEAG